MWKALAALVFIENWLCAVFVAAPILARPVCACGSGACAAPIGALSLWLLGASALAVGGYGMMIGFAYFSRYPCIV